MADFDYLRDRVRGMSVSSMVNAARQVHERSDMSTVGVLFDMTRCGLKYSAGYTDYLNGSFEAKTAPERSSYITRGVNNSIVRAMNSRELESCFDDKRQFFALYKQYARRRHIDIERANAGQLRKFCEGRERVVVRRPISGEEDVFSLSLLGVDDYDDLRERLLRMGLSLVEESLERHEDVTRLCGEYEGRIRVVTARKHIVFACLVCSVGRHTLISPLDIESGTVTSSAVDENNLLWHRHPVTHEHFEGFSVPLWDNVTLLARSAAEILPSVGYCGWDIAVLPDGVELLDASCFPRHDYYRVCDNSALRRRIEAQMKSGGNQT